MSAPAAWPPRAAPACGSSTPPTTPTCTRCLQPFVLKVALQWFIVYSTLARGIRDLDERALMGHQVLSGAGWP